MKLYAYVCEKHGGATPQRMMTQQELDAMIREHHLDNCQVKGCQFKRDRVQVFEVTLLEPKV